MPTLSSTLRRTLEATCVKARTAAEKGSREALDGLAVQERDPFPSMTEEKRQLRERLQAHGRQLGDEHNVQKGIQGIERLVQEMAYEHWHRMLFARFLAENNLLIETEHQVPVSLAECEELAQEEGVDPWELAASYAQDMLPQIFRVDDPVLAVKLPPESCQTLRKLVADLDAETFAASDSLGWVYQFWQVEEKKRVNQSEVKIGADELPVVTQLFTEPYMVSFLLDNALGAWWAARRLSPTDLQNASNEKELRQKAAIPGVPLDYLRFVQQDNGNWDPAAGTFPDWPQHLADLKVLDPCCGSGHFLVAAFLMLVPMRMELEGLSAQAAVDAVLRDNIHGLEIDKRCVEIAVFALALTAWKIRDAGGYRSLPKLNLACSGLPVSAAKEEWKQLGQSKKNLAIALGWMHDTFKDAPLLGSLLDPARSDAGRLMPWHEVAGAVQEALKQECNQEQREIGVVAQDLAKSADLLTKQYHLIITNVPYLGRNKQDKQLKNFCQNNYPIAKNDLATVFLERCLQLCIEGGTASVALPHKLLFMPRYSKQRKKLLREVQWKLLACLGEKGFDSSQAAGAFVILLAQTKCKPSVDSQIQFFDVSESRSPVEKADLLRRAKILAVRQDKQMDNPDARITFQESSNFELLQKYANGWQGIASSDSPRFCLYFWEINELSKVNTWALFQSTVKETKYYGGRQKILLWEDGYGAMIEACQEGATFRGRSAWGLRGIACSQMRDLYVTLYNGEKFDNNTSVLTSHNSEQLVAIWCFCKSEKFRLSVKEIDKTIKVTNSTLVKVPFNLKYWQKVASEHYPNGLPRPFSSDPTQWVFHGHPYGSVVWDEKVRQTVKGPLRIDSNVLQVALARLLGYRWPTELDASMELANEQRQWVEDCDTLLSYADQDGIVCLSPIRGERSAAERLRSLLAVAFGEDWTSAKERELLMAAPRNTTTNSTTSLDDWLRKNFFAQHCKLFQSRPFIWQIWDGNAHGFSALVNYHKLAGPNGEGRRTLDLLTYTHLSDWIDRQRLEQAQGVDGADDRLAAALDLQGQLKKILAGEPPYDIFVRWKPLHRQPMGWEPDLNDGVRLNIRPFLKATLRRGGRRGAGILRQKPNNIKWGKDRGKEPQGAKAKEDYPWFWGWDERDHALATNFGAPIPDAPAVTSDFDGNRCNDLHYTRAAKQAARDRHGEGA